MKNVNANEQAIRARNVFVDQERYDDQKMLGYLRLAEKIYCDSSLVHENSLMAEGIDTILEQMTEQQKKVIEMRYVAPHTLREVGKALNITGEAVRRIEKSCIEYMRINLNAFSIQEQEKLEEAKIELINQIRIGGIPQSGLSIKVLNLSIRAYNSLMRKGIKTLDQLLKCSRRDLLTIPDIGNGTVEEIYRKIENFIPERTDIIRKGNDIASLGLTNKCCQFLRAEGINTVEQLYNLSKKDLCKIPGISASKIHQIETKLTQWFADWEANDDISEKHLDEIDIYYLNLGTRAYRALYSNGITTVGKVIALTDMDLNKIRNLGEKSIQEINVKVNIFVNKRR